MTSASKEPELPLLDTTTSDTVIINARCILRREGSVHVVYVGGLPMYPWTDGDRVTEAYAMITLVKLGYADQNEVARAFRYSRKTLWRDQRRCEASGMSALGRSRGRPQGAQAAQPAWVQTAATLRRNGMRVRAIARRLNISGSTVSKWLGRLGASVPPSANASPEPARHRTPNTSHAPAVEESATEMSNDVGRDWSLPTDPTNRVLDRLLARLGKLDDADPVFAPDKRIPRAGILLAIPALVQSGIFSIAEEVYGNIGPAFYGLRTSMLAMLLMALLRIKRPEDLKEHRPPDLGRVLGLDRAPEVKTLRRKLKRLASFGKAEVFGRKLAQKRVASHGAMMGFLYIDGHVRVYHGRRKLPKAHVTRMRLALPATTDYWVNDKNGDPVFVVTAEVNAAMTKMLPELLLKDVRSLVGKGRRITVVFDRAGWSPKLFVKLIKAGFDILTYRKGKKNKKIPRNQFKTCQRIIEGRKVRYELNDRNIRLLKGKLRLRQITRLSKDGHQTPIVTSRKDLTALTLAYRMFRRWRQENFFKYLLEEYALDALVDYTVESEDPERSVPNPDRRKAEKKLAKARAKLRKLEALYGGAAMSNRERSRRTIRGFKIAHGKLGREIRELQKKVAALAARRSRLPKRVAVKEMAGGPIVRLSRERKHLTNCIKMVAYQAESDLLALLGPHYKRVDDEGRTLVTSALQSQADIEVDEKELRVTLAPLSSEHRSKAIAAMCETLNQMEVCFPGTKLRLRFGVARAAFSGQNGTF